MQKGIYIIVVFLFYTIMSKAQTDWFSALDSTYNAYIDNMNEEYDDYINRMDEEFCKYLEQEWNEFDVYFGLDEFEHEDFEVSQIPKEIEITPIFFQHKANINYKTVTLHFFGETLNFKIDHRTHFELKSISENNISSAWRQLASSDFYSILKTANDFRLSNKLNDWATFLLFEKLSESFFSENKYNERIIFITFLLNHTGFDCKFGRLDKDIRMDEKLVCLLPFKTRVMHWGNIKMNQKLYYMRSYEPSTGQKTNIDTYSKVYSYKENHSLAKIDLSLFLYHIPVLGNENIKKEITIQKKNEEILLNKNLCDFYSTYPNATLPVYFASATSSELKHIFINRFEPTFKNENKVQAVNTLLTWFHSLPYATDESLYNGRQRIFFPEETLLYPKSDCEDRAILFAHIVRECLGLKTVLFEFKDHVATGVCFESTKPEGFSKEYKGRTYTVCDPTFVKGAVGMISDKININSLKVIESNK